MKGKLIDTNIIIRYLVESPKGSKFQNVFELFEKIEKKEIVIFIEPLVLGEAYFVLTKFYQVPRKDVCKKLIELLGFSGVQLTNKNVAIKSLKRLETKNIDFVDAFLIELSLEKNMCIYTSDKHLIKSEADTENVIL